MTTWRVVLAFGIALAAWLAWTPSSGPPSFSQVDKLEHLLAFASLGVAACKAFPARRAAVLWALLGFGVLIEIVQSGMPSRSADWLDVVADAAGLGVGWCLSAWWQAGQPHAN